VFFYNFFLKNLKKISKQSLKSSISIDFIQEDKKLFLFLENIVFNSLFKFSNFSQLISINSQVLGFEISDKPFLNQIFFKLSLKNIEYFSLH
jgi:hypothetical protein